MSGRAPRGVAVAGLGRAGTEIVKAVGTMPGLRLVAGVVHSPAKAGQDVGTLAGIDPLGVAATDDLERVLADPRVDAVLHGGLGDPAAVATFVGRCAERGKDAITVSGLVHPRTALDADRWATLRRQAEQGGARIVGTGFNPGFILDVLPVAWGSVVNAIEYVEAIRVSEIRSWGAGIMDELGVGCPVEDVVDRSALSVAESLWVIVDGLGLEVDEVHETVEPYPSGRTRVHHDRTIEPGQSAGFVRRATATRDGRKVAEVAWSAVLELGPEDGIAETARLAIRGDSEVEAEARGTFFGDPYPATAARAVRAVEALALLPPGVYRPDQLPLGAS